MSHVSHVSVAIHYYELDWKGVLEPPKYASGVLLISKMLATAITGAQGIVRIKVSASVIGPCFNTQACLPLARCVHKVLAGVKHHWPRLNLLTDPLCCREREKRCRKIMGPP